MEMEEIHRIIAGCSLEDLRAAYENDDYLEVKNVLKATQLSNLNINSMMNEYMAFNNLSERNIMSSFTEISAEHKKFEEMRKLREEADVSGYWLPLWAYADFITREFTHTLALFALVFDLNRILVEKMYEKLDQSYRKGSDWQEISRGEDMAEVKRSFASMERLRQKLGISSEELLQETRAATKREAERLKETRLGYEKAMSERMKEEIRVKVQEEEKQTTQPVNTRRILELVSGDATKKLAALKEMADTGELQRMQGKGKEVLYSFKKPERLGDTVSPRPENQEE